MTTRCDQPPSPVENWNESITKSTYTRACSFKFSPGQKALGYERERTVHEAPGWTASRAEASIYRGLCEIAKFAIYREKSRDLPFSAKYRKISKFSRKIAIISLSVTGYRTRGRKTLGRRTLGRRTLGRRTLGRRLQERISPRGWTLWQKYFYI